MLLAADMLYNSRNAGVYGADGADDAMAGGGRCEVSVCGAVGAVVLVMDAAYYRAGPGCC